MTRFARSLFVAMLLPLAVPAGTHAQQSPTQPPATAPSPAPHTGHQHPPAPAPAPPKPAGEHAHGQHEHHEGSFEPLPPITDADRAAAFPDVAGHAVHDRAVHTFVLLDEFEWQGGGIGSWDNTNWIGGDVHRVWLRSEGEIAERRVERADVHVLYGKAVSPWWDVVGGVRQDVRPGPSRTWLALGVQGLAPYWFEVEATGYVGEGGRTHARIEIEYELLFTNRLVLQPSIEFEAYGKADPERGIGTGISSTEVGLRLRYEFRRELAPYVGLTWERRYGGTADFARHEGEDEDDLRAVIGLRFWF